MDIKWKGRVRREFTGCKRVGEICQDTQNEEEKQDEEENLRKMKRATGRGGRLKCRMEQKCMDFQTRR